MKRFWIPLLLCLPLLPAHAAEPNGVDVPGFGRAEQARADGIGIIGPVTADTGDEVVFRLTGTPPLDLTLPLIDQLDWLMGDDRMFCYLAAPGAPLLALDVRGELVFSPAGATMQPLLRVLCGRPGGYRVLVDWNHGQNQLAEHRFVVGGDGPEPDPEPDPDPDPIPPPPGPLAEMWLIVVEETNQRTPEQAWVLLDPTVRRWMKANGHHLRIVDKDQKASDLQEWINRATAQTNNALPYLFVVDDSGAVSFEGELPIGPIQMLELVKKWGVEK